MSVLQHRYKTLEVLYVNRCYVKLADAQIMFISSYTVFILTQCLFLIQTK